MGCNNSTQNVADDKVLTPLSFHNLTNCSLQFPHLEVETAPGRLEDKYTVGKFLGKGNFASVYEITRISDGDGFWH